jgi:hypothetical protein
MVSCSSISLVLSGIDRHLQDLSLTQTRKLTEQVKGLLDDPASLTDASAVDVEMFCTAFDETPDAWKFMSFDPTTNTLADEMKALPQSEVKRLMKEVRSIAKDDRSRLAEILRQPEKDWFKSETPNQSSLANRFYQAVAAPPHSLVTFAQCRTQIRLLRLHRPNRYDGGRRSAHWRAVLLREAEERGICSLESRQRQDGENRA